MVRAWLAAAAVVVIAAGGVEGATAAPADHRPTVAHDCRRVDLTARGYVTSGGQVRVVDTARRRLTGTSISGITVPIFTYAAPGGRTVYVDDWGTGELHVVDACTATVTRSIPIGAFNQGVLSADGRYLYDYPILGTKVSVIDTATASVVRTIEVPPVVSAALSRDGRTLFVGGFFDVSIIDVRTGQLLGTTMVDPVPAWMAVTPDGAKFYTANIDGTVTVGDARRATVIKTIPFGLDEAPLWVTVSPDGSQAWVALGAGGVAVIATRTDEVLRTVPTSGMAIAVEFDAAGHAFVSDGGPETKQEQGLVAILLASFAAWANTPGRILAVDTKSFDVLKVIDVPGMPGNVAIPR